MYAPPALSIEALQSLTATVDHQESDNDISDSPYVFNCFPRVSVLKQQVS
jgi:hypothetical protein